MKKIIVIAVIALVAVAGAVCIFITVSQARFRPVIPASTRQYHDITFTETAGRPIRLDLYLPADRGPHPVIVWFHSGAWKTLDKSCIEQGVMDQTKRGYAVASVGYSLSQQAVWPAQLAEAQAAVHWVRAHAVPYGLDPDRLVAWGMSSGAHIASLLGVTGPRDDVRAVIAWSPPVDLTRLTGDSYAAAVELLGGETNLLSEAGRLAGVPAWVGPGSPPFFIMQGTDDRTVLPEQGEWLAAALRENGVRVVLRTLPGYTHTDVRCNDPDNLEEVQAFLDSICKK